MFLSTEALSNFPDLHPTEILCCFSWFQVHKDLQDSFKENWVGAVLCFQEVKPGDGSLFTLLLLWLSAHLGGSRPVLCCPWLGYLALCFYKVGIISGCCLSLLSHRVGKKKGKSTVIFMTTVPLEICLQGFKQSFGFQYILVSMRWKRPKCRQAGRLSCSRPSLWSRWPEKGCHGWSISMVKLVLSDMPGVNISMCSVKTEAYGGRVPFGEVSACADWSGRGQYSCLPVEITCHPVQPWMDCALELRLCNILPGNLLFLFLTVTPAFPLRRQPRGPGSSRAVSVW